MTDRDTQEAGMGMRRSQWFESLRISAEEVLRLRLKVNDLRNAGEDDPATDEFKCMAMALVMAWDNYREKVAPREILDLVKIHSTLTEENARLSIRVKEMEERETPGASEAFTALDLADNLIERSYGTDVPVEWKRAIKKVVRARAALEQSK